MTRSLDFFAQSVQIKRADGVLLVALGEFAGPDPGRYLLLQRADEFSAQDRALKQDTYSVEIDPAMAGYGCLARATLGRDRLKLEISLVFAKNFDGLERVEVRFEISDELWQELKGALGKVLGRGILRG